MLPLKFHTFSTLISPVNCCGLWRWIDFWKGVNCRTDWFSFWQPPDNNNKQTGFGTEVAQRVKEPPQGIFRMVLIELRERQTVDLPESIRRRRGPVVIVVRHSLCGRCCWPMQEGLAWISIFWSISNMKAKRNCFKGNSTYPFDSWRRWKFQYNTTINFFSSITAMELVNSNSRCRRW